MLGDVQRIVAACTRTVLAQGVGLVGLLWCLSESLASIGSVLLVLLLIDQAVFLRTHLKPGAERLPFRSVIVGAIFVIGFVDLLLVFAVWYRVLGIVDLAGRPLPAGALDAMSLSLGTFAHGTVGLAPGSPGSRLLAAIEAMLVFPFAVVVAVMILRRRR